MLKPILISGLLMTSLVSTSISAKEWAFDVYLDNSKIGQHVFKLSETNELTSAAKFNVKVLFINAYQYDHKAVEQWQGDCLNTLESRTIENKVESNIKAKLSAQEFTVDDGKVKQNLPACTMTFAYWNPKIIKQAKLLNPQNGEWLDTKFTNLGTETIAVKNKKIEANHYKLDGSLNGKSKLKIELWYAANNEWLALKSITPEGYTINYKLR
ncbi:MAG: DUF6134 family protein [Methylotenera sp.]|uniref:DUF6134 family protein n=1 Tax=Methylotenera sp. TaxID=2051956 RepID=UPI0024877CB1|nr:DUF6134 family protein [Methylotenera sp.]MDI1309511.1 DUF6134 family protein [Methylotenera sp.]